MTNMETKDLLLIHAVVAKKTKHEGGVSDINSLKMISHQLASELSSSPTYKQAAYIAYSIQILKPFTTLNNATAFLAAVSYMRTQTGHSIDKNTSIELEQAIKSNRHLDELSHILKGATS